MTTLVSLHETHRWVSQDLVRKANRDQPGPHNMHGDTTV